VKPDRFRVLLLGQIAEFRTVNVLDPVIEERTYGLRFRAVHEAEILIVRQLLQETVCGAFGVRITELADALPGDLSEVNGSDLSAVFSLEDGARAMLRFTLRFRCLHCYP